MRLAVRLGIWGAAAPILAGCATGSGVNESGAAAERACGVEDCFFERDVRDFEVLNNTTLILYVGAQRCPFRVELDGTFCDMTMAPQVFFRTPEERRISQQRGEDELDPRSLMEQQRRRDELSRGAAMSRICSNDRVEVDGGVFTEDFGVAGGVATQRRECVIRSVASLTDDQLVELYVDRGVVAPPPPIGPGEIEVNPEQQGEAAPSAEPEAGDPENGPAGGAREEPSTAAARDDP